MMSLFQVSICVESSESQRSGVQSASRMCKHSVVNLRVYVRLMENPRRREWARPVGVQNVQSHIVVKSSRRRDWASLHRKSVNHSCCAAAIQLKLPVKMQSCHQSSNTKTEKQPSSLKACSRTADAKGRQYGDVSIDMYKEQDL